MGGRVSESLHYWLRVHEGTARAYPTTKARYGLSPVYSKVCKSIDGRPPRGMRRSASRGEPALAHCGSLRCSAAYSTMYLSPFSKAEFLAGTYMKPLLGRGLVHVERGNELPQQVQRLLACQPLFMRVCAHECASTCSVCARKRQCVHGTGMGQRDGPVSRRFNARSRSNGGKFSELSSGRSVSLNRI